MIYTENTPNPNAVKFLTETTLSEVGATEFQKKNIKNIKNNFIKNFISVKKNEKVKWDALKPSIISLMNDHIEKVKRPILSKKIEQNLADKINKKEDSVIERINEVLDSKIRPAVSKDGGDIKFVSFENGKVKVELRGSCSGCPSSLITLKNGVQNLLRHYVKEVTDVEAI